MYENDFSNRSIASKSDWFYRVSDQMKTPSESLKKIVVIFFIYLFLFIFHFRIIYLKIMCIYFLPFKTTLKIREKKKSF